MNKTVVLVDYSNVIKQSNLLEATVDDIIRRLMPYCRSDGLGGRCECVVRLYDGWDEQEKIRRENDGGVTISSALSRNAQDAARVVSVCFPKVYHNISVSVELARSILAAPKMPLLYTLRKKQEFYRLRLVDKDDMCCGDAMKHHEFLNEYIKKRRCSHCKQKNELMQITEQKLVDTMIVSDMLYLRNYYDSIAIASDDDDMIPGIMQFLMSGGTVYHLRNRDDQFTYCKYRNSFSETYDSKRYHVLV